MAPATQPNSSGSERRDRDEVPLAFQRLDLPGKVLPLSEKEIKELKAGRVI
jgi:hypothetical protein